MNSTSYLGCRESPSSWDWGSHAVFCTHRQWVLFLDLDFGLSPAFRDLLLSQETPALDPEGRASTLLPVSSPR